MTARYKKYVTKTGRSESCYALRPSTVGELADFLLECWPRSIGQDPRMTFSSTGLAWRASIRGLVVEVQGGDWILAASDVVLSLNDERFAELFQPERDIFKETPRSGREVATDFIGGSMDGVTMLLEPIFEYACPGDGRHFSGSRCTEVYRHTACSNGGRRAMTLHSVEALRKS